VGGFWDYALEAGRQVVVKLQQGRAGRADLFSPQRYHQLQRDTTTTKTWLFPPASFYYINGTQDAIDKNGRIEAFWISWSAYEQSY
jgi:hypothetical protein